MVGDDVVGVSGESPFSESWQKFDGTRLVSQAAQSLSVSAKLLSGTITSQYLGTRMWGPSSGAWCFLLREIEFGREHRGRFRVADCAVYYTSRLVGSTRMMIIVLREFLLASNRFMFILGRLR